MDADHASWHRFPAQESGSRLTLAQLAARLETMVVVEQAKGIIMAKVGCTESLAFDILRAASQRSNVPVRRLAAQLVARTSGNNQPPPGLDVQIIVHSADGGHTPLGLLSNPGPDGRERARPGR